VRWLVVDRDGRVWRTGIAFAMLDPEPPEKLSVSPRTVIDDNVCFRRAN
jgi:hypothetical protein